MTESIQTPKKSKVAIFLLAGLSVILALALAACLYLLNRENNRAVSAMATVSSQQKTMEEDMISIELLQQRSQQYSVGIPFLQSFFDDRIVYKNNTGVVYAPIRSDLPKNGYDFTALSYQDGIAKYTDKNGVKGITGIDVSRYQGKIDWDKVKTADISYAFIRTGYRGYDTGKIMQDDTCKTNLIGASKAGIDLGVYFYSQAITTQEAVEEADFVLDTIEGFDIRYPIVFDMEEVTSDTARTADLTPSEITDITISFCERVKDAGYIPMIYGNVQWMLDHLELERLTTYDKWFAQYFNKPFFPYEFQIWQYSATGEIPGIEGDVDLNLCFKNYTE